MMFEQIGMKKIFLILTLLIILVYLVFFVYLPYEKFQRCKNEGCTFDLGQIWQTAPGLKSGCSFNISQSLIYSVHITNNPDGSVANFSCEFGEIYPAVNAAQPRVIIQQCDRETAELIDLAVRGQKTTPYVRMDYPIPNKIKDYTYEVLACTNYTSGPHTGKYITVHFVNSSGVFYQ